MFAGTIAILVTVGNRILKYSLKDRVDNVLNILMVDVVEDQTDFLVLLNAALYVYSIKSLHLTMEQKLIKVFRCGNIMGYI